MVESLRKEPIPGGWLVAMPHGLGRPNSGDSIMNEEQQIRDILKGIQAAFEKLDISAWFQYFHKPCLIVLPDVVLSPASETEAEALAKTEAERLRSKGYAKSVMEKFSIKFLTETTALVGTAWSRFDNQDNLIEDLSVTYIFFKSNDTWYVSMLTTHPVSTAVEI